MAFFFIQFLKIFNFGLNIQIPNHFTKFYSYLISQNIASKIGAQAYITKVEKH